MAANKLNRRARDLVRFRILAGDTNSEIRQALRDAGYDASLTNAALSHYRQKPEIKQTVTEFVRRLKQGASTGRFPGEPSLQVLAERAQSQPRTTTIVHSPWMTDEGAVATERINKAMERLAQWHAQKKTESEAEKSAK